MIDERTQARMAEATRLTQEGRLNEATALLQTALGNGTPNGSPSGFPGGSPTTAAGADGFDLPIDVTSRLVGGASRGPAAPWPGAGLGTDAFTRPAPNLRTRGVRHPPGSPFAKTSRAGGVGDEERFFTRQYSGAAGARSYKLYVPEGYTGEEEEGVPLVVMLHGCTQDPDDFAAGTRMNALADEHTFLVAYPAQSANANMQKCWNWFQPADQGRDRGEPSIIAGITRQVIEEYRVDEGRVYVAGMSAGGAMAAILGAAYPDLYAAAGVHSGLAPGSAHDMPSAFSAMRQGSPGAPMPEAGSNGRARMVPTIVFHGDRDGTVHPRNGDRVLAGLTAGGGPSLKVTTRQGSVPDGHAFTRISYKDIDGRPVFERWNVHGLAHAWSGGGSPGSYTDPKGPDASAEMVRFFLEHGRG